jgi:hypothetical protein
MAKYTINDTTLTGIADAIRAKGGTSAALTPAQMPEAIAAIQAGGGGGATPSAKPKDVNFYDYDGTLLYSYTLAEAQALTALPDSPTHDGLTFQKWNKSLEKVKAATRKMDVGATYITSDGKTRIFIRLKEGRTSPMLGVCPKGTVDVDWGDGTAHDTLTGTSTATVQWTPTHEYAAPGDYVISLTVDGKMGLLGSSSENQGAYILRYSSGGDNRNHLYRNAIEHVQIGSNVTSISTHAFSYCYSLNNVVIPDGVMSIGNNAFNYCYSLNNVVIPDGVTSIGSNAFAYCYSLNNVVIPDGVKSIVGYVFNNCYSLNNVVIPDGVTSIISYAFSNCRSLNNVVIPDGVTSIDSNVFSSCYSLNSVVIPDSVTSVSSSAFSSCYGVKFYDFTQNTSVPTLSNTNAFNNIPADCEIRVPAALYDEWIAATNWSTYASKIVAV